MKNPRAFIALLAGAALFTVAGCRVPLKTPPIQMDAAVPKIDWKLLADFAKAAGDAYETTAVIEAAYGKDNVVVRDLPADDGRYFILFNHKDKIQTISVRGTTSKANAWSDINSIKVPDAFTGIYLHRGFKASADSAYTDMRPFLQKDYKTRITGHSLGGAIAAILMFDLVKDGYSIDEVLTFGQPKITNEAGGKKAPNVPYFRVINDGDVVAQVPPSTIIYDLSGPYEHFGPEITLHADKTFSYSPVHIPRDVLADDLWKTIKPGDVQDHFIKNYIDRIKALQ